MKVLLTTLNSKFVHTNLAIRYLKSFCKHIPIEICEYTINDNVSNIISDIYLKHPDIIAFSCYIWNIEQTLKIISTLKKSSNNIKIILGGPEVSYDPQEFLEKYPEIDFIVFGEGELTFKELLEGLISGKSDFSKIRGLAYRKDEKVIVNPERELIADLDILEFPYENEKLKDLEGRIVYYESSRGCPFNCQYCLSSTTRKVRFFSMDRVKSDLKKLVDAGVSQVKFVDRTFNCNKSRTIEIFEYLLELSPNINFHFEIVADLLDEEILNILKHVPEGLFQFEIGVQSTNPQTLDAICRKSNFEKLSKVINFINQSKNIHIHLDLIAGLPFEGYESFKKSFNDVYNLKPQMLQLGFLKLLRGSGLRLNAEKYGIKYNDYPPYEVISTNLISFDEIVKLKDIEECLEKYYNSKKFYKSLDYVINNFYKSSFEFYEHFSSYWRENGLFGRSHSLKELYTIFVEFFEIHYKNNTDIFNELIKYDFLSNNHNYVLPEKVKRSEYEIRQQIFKFLEQPENVEKFLPQYLGWSAKDIIKKIHVEAFDFDVLSPNFDKKLSIILFDYDVKNKTFMRSNTYNITEYLS